MESIKNSILNLIWATVLFAFVFGMIMFGHALITTMLQVTLGVSYVSTAIIGSWGGIVMAISYSVLRIISKRLVADG